MCNFKLGLQSGTHCSSIKQDLDRARDPSMTLPLRLQSKGRKASTSRLHCAPTTQILLPLPQVTDGDQAAALLPELLQNFHLTTSNTVTECLPQRDPLQITIMIKEFNMHVPTLWPLRVWKFPYVSPSLTSSLRFRPTYVQDSLPSSSKFMWVEKSARDELLRIIQK